MRVGIFVCFVYCYIRSIQNSASRSGRSIIICRLLIVRISVPREHDSTQKRRKALDKTPYLLVGGKTKFDHLPNLK